MGLIDKTQEEYYLGPDGIWDSHDEDYGGYQFVPINDIINTFMVAYVGEDKNISKVKRTDVQFHAMRAIQEFSFDMLPQDKAVEIDVPPGLYFVLPQDYVNFTKLSWTDTQGIERPIYRTNITSNPSAPLQDTDYEYNPDLLGLYAYGRRYGLDPELAQANGTFYIDNANGVVRFSSDLRGKLITLKYISDGLGSDEDMVVHKFAVDAIYKYILHAILSTRANTQEYLVARYKRELAAARRNAKIRLSQLKSELIAQVMRNQSKWIKH